LLLPVGFSEQTFSQQIPNPFSTHHGKMLVEHLQVLPPERPDSELFQHASRKEHRQETQTWSAHQESLILQNLMNLQANWFEHKDFHYLYA